MTDEPPFLLTREVAARLGVRRERVHELVEAGVLHPVRWSRQGWFRFPRDEVERFLKNGAAPAAGESARAGAGSAAAVPVGFGAAARPTTPREER